jgi:hypothetical protein
VLRNGGAISGQLLDDAGKPIQGWSVAATHLSTHSISVEVVSDEAGGFAFDPLTPGPYWIRARPPRASSLPSVADLLPAGWTVDDGSNDEKRASVTVVDGQTSHVVLGGRPGESIRIRGSIRSGGRPRAACQVTAYRQNDSNQNPRPCTSDEQGLYELLVDGSGGYELTVRPSDGGLTLSEHVEVPDRPIFAHDIELPTGRIAGRVVGRNGTPAKDVDVALLPDAHSSELTSSTWQESRTTDESGAFVFEGLSPGIYALRAGASAGASRFDPSSANIGVGSRSGIQVTEGGRVEGIELRLQSVARVEVTVVGPGGAPVGNANVFAIDDRGDPMYDLWTATDSTGRFSLDGLEPSKTRFGAFTKVLAPAGFEAVALQPGETSRVELAVRPGTRLRLLFEDSAGQRIFASVRAVDDGGVDWGWMSFLPVVLNGGAPDAKDGSVVGPLPPGHYRVTATSQARKSTSADVSVSGDEQTVTLRFE